MKKQINIVHWLVSVGWLPKTAYVCIPCSKKNPSLITIKWLSWLFNWNVSAQLRAIDWLESYIVNNTEPTTSGAKERERDGDRGEREGERDQYY